MGDTLTLLIIAAGMGSRYGSLKQIEPIGPHGEAIIDYSMYDAVKAGFNKIVFVIRSSFEEAFRKNIGNKLVGLIETDYVYQDLNSGISDFVVPASRDKPWGTGHAVLLAREAVSKPFAVINADDYYGPHSYQLLAKHLRSEPDDFAMVGFPLKQTLSEHGEVARGICACDVDRYLQNVIERTNIRKQGTGAIFKDEDNCLRTLTGDEIVSMNLWGFTPRIFNQINCLFHIFLHEHGHKQKSEFYLSSAIGHLIAERQIRVKVITTPDQWFGVTYREDKPVVQKNIRELIEQGVYPANLWASL